MVSIVPPAWSSCYALVLALIINRRYYLDARTAFILLCKISPKTTLSNIPFDYFIENRHLKAWQS